MDRRLEKLCTVTGVSGATEKVWTKKGTFSSLLLVVLPISGHREANRSQTDRFCWKGASTFCGSCFLWLPLWGKQSTCQRIWVPPPLYVCPVWEGTRWPSLGLFRVQTCLTITSMSQSLGLVPDGCYAVKSMIRWVTRANADANISKCKCEDGGLACAGNPCSSMPSIYGLF